MVPPPAHRASERLLGDRTLAFLALLAALTALVIFAYLTALRPPQTHLWGDEGTYLAMTASLSRDGDLAFSEADRDWALERGAIDRDAEVTEGNGAPTTGSADSKGVTIILQRTAAGITYSKPLLYPLLAALPHRFLGEPGILLVNGGALLLGLLAAGLYLRRLGSGGPMWLTLVTFAACAALAPYLAWRMSEALQVGLALVGLVLACGGLRSPESDPYSPAGRASTLLDHRAAPWIGGALLGLLTAMRTSNAIVLAGALAACLLLGGLRRSLAVVGGSIAGLALILTVSQAALGTISPYTAERASFNARIGYPVGPDAAAALARFDEKPATHRPHLEVSAAQRYSALYFFVGRHSGLLAYFPFALAMIYLLLRRPDRLGLLMLGTALALAVFYLLYTPHNYFGGSTFIGNRYFLIAYPALLIGLKELPSPKVLLSTLALGLIFGGSAVASVRLARPLDGTSQSHTAAGAFRRLPYETTAREIQGQKYRFWSGDYLRFTDHWATVERRRFVLHSDRPYTELMLARSLIPPRMHFLVRPAELAGSLSWRTATGLAWRRLTPDSTRPGVVSIEAGRTWRQHPLGWASRAIYDLRILQLRLEAEDSERTQAQIYYLGGDTGALDAFPPEVLSVQVPSEGRAGGAGRIELEIRNTSGTIWSPEDVLPITVGCRLGASAREVSRLQRPIDQVVAPGASAILELAIEWPETPGEYTLTVEVALHPLRSMKVTEQPVVVRAVEVNGWVEADDDVVP